MKVNIHKKTLERLRLFPFSLFILYWKVGFKSSIDVTKHSILSNQIRKCIHPKVCYQQHISPYDEKLSVRKGIPMIHLDNGKFSCCLGRVWNKYLFWFRWGSQQISFCMLHLVNLMKFLMVSELPFSREGNQFILRFHFYKKNISYTEKITGTLFYGKT